MTVTQSFAALPQVGCVWVIANRADINNDGFVNGVDLASLLSAWGTTGPIGDIDQDGLVGGADLSALLSGWSP